MNKPNSRRNFFKLTVGLAGAMVTSKAVARMCTIKTAEQPLGPFFPNSGTPQDPIREDQNPDTPIYLANDNDLTFVKGRGGKAQGQEVLITGVLTNQACQPIAGASLIVWQASASGRYNHQGDNQNEDFTHPITGEIISRKLDPNFQYWGRTLTDKDGNYSFKTVVPGFYPANLNSGWYRPPHIHYMVSATGYPQFVTQTYFKSAEIKDNDFIQELNQKDLLLQSNSLNQAERQDLIIDFKNNQDQSVLMGEFNIQLKS